MKLLLLVIARFLISVLGRSIHCRDPGLGSHNLPGMKSTDKKFLLIGGVGEF